MYLLTGLQVLGNSEIAVCEQMEGMNATQDFTAGNGSETMPNGTTGERNVTCVTCGKLYPKYSPCRDQCCFSTMFEVSV